MVVTPEWVRAQYAKIVEKQNDPESAHWDEDRLYLTILQAILNDDILEGKECIREALKTQDLPFSRWYA